MEPGVRACNRAAALHGSRFAPMCSALLPFTALNDESQVVLQSCFRIICSI